MRSPDPPHLPAALGWTKADWRFEDVRRHLDPAFLTRLLTASEDQDPRTVDPPATACVRAACRKLVDQEPGVLIFEGLAASAVHAWPLALRRLCRILGTKAAQDPQGMVTMREVRDRGGSLDDRQVRYSDTRAGGGFHTDGVLVPGTIPEYVALLCVRQAATGGELVFIDARSVLDRLRRASADAEGILRGPFCFDQRRADDPEAVVSRPVFSLGKDGSVEIAYLRSYIDSAHGMPWVRDLSPRETAALDLLDSVVEDEEFHVEGRLEPGDIAIMNNRRLLHGRHTFEDQGGAQKARLMLRVWLTKDLDD
jgi:alpha-ketoglutarate-dependent taurine dioxygenase